MLPVQKLDEYTCQDVRIILNVEPRTKLGLGICKGPEWKPGIFVQFTKEVGIARDAGLRPGDQLLSCNDIDFSDVLFSEVKTNGTFCYVNFVKKKSFDRL